MTPLDALHSVFEKGERCQECLFRIRTWNPDLHQRERGCSAIEGPYDPLDCPGVEDELNKESEE